MLHFLHGGGDGGGTAAGAKRGNTAVGVRSRQIAVRVRQRWTGKLFTATAAVGSSSKTSTQSQVRAIAFGNASQLRVRWDNDPEFWGDLLVACRGRDERAMAALRRQGKLLFCGELIESHK